MCPFIALLILFQIFCLICDVTSVKIDIKFPSNKTKEIQVEEGGQQNVSFILKDFNNRSNLTFKIRDPSVVGVNEEFIELYQIKTKEIEETIVFNGKLFGFTKFDIVYNEKDSVPVVLETLEVVAYRKANKALESTFTGLVIVLVSLNIINMGCALDLKVVNETLSRPYAIIIGFITHYFFMPMLAYFIGKVLFSDAPYLRLSLFIFGCSPGGSAANMWTVLLGGNLNLSVTMTFISTLCAVFMMPFWLFLLGNNILENSAIHVPFSNIFASLLSLVVCISIGLGIQKYKPKLAQKSKKILAPVSGFLIVFVVIFASATYWYLFKRMTLDIILAATLNVWLGFAIGALFGIIFRQKFEDIISITVETGIQNTGIVFVILRVALSPPFDLLSMTIPVASSCITAIPLTVLFLIMKYRKRSQKKSDSDQMICQSGERTPIRSNQLAVETE